MRFFVTVPIGLEAVALEDLREGLPSAAVPAGEAAEHAAQWPTNWRVKKGDRKLGRRLRRGLETAEGVAGAELPMDLDAELLAVKPTTFPGVVRFDADSGWGSAAAGAAPLKAAKAVFLELAEAELPATDATEGVEAVFATDLLAAMAPGALQGAVAEWRRWSGIDAAALPDSELSFRVTVDKVIDFSDSANKKYGFSSQQAAGWLGFGVGAATRWKVDLKHYRLHLLCLLYRRRLRLGLALTDTEASNARNRAAFGRTSLQVQVAHCMARMARPVAGEVLLDLFCGTGIIPIEAEQHCPHILALGSDVDPEETERAGQNVRFAGASAGVLTADASRLPLRDASVTKIVSDMPWGRRCGGYVGNTALYPKFLREARRVIQPGGDMFLLTLEKGIMRRYLGSDEARWSLARAYHVRNGFDVVLLHLKPV